MTPNPYEPPLHCGETVATTRKPPPLVQTVGSIFALLFGFTLMPVFWRVLAVVLSVPEDVREYISFVLYVGSGILIVGLSRRLEKNTELPTFTLRLGSLAFVGTAILYGLCSVLVLAAEFFVGDSPIDGILALVFTVAYLLTGIVSVLEWLATLTGRVFAFLCRSEA